MFKTKNRSLAPLRALLKAPFWICILLVLIVAIPAPANASAGHAPVSQATTNVPDQHLTILSAKDAFLYTYDQIATLDHEEARVLFVDATGAVLKVASVTQNFRDGIYYIPWEVAFGNFTPAGTQKIYMVHNHPNGANWLSDADIELGSFWAHKVARLGITLDLIAVTAHHGYASMRESGQIKPEQNGLAGALDNLDFIVQPGLAMVGEEIARVVRR